RASGKILAVHSPARMVLLGRAPSGHDCCWIRSVGRPPHGIPAGGWVRLRRAVSNDAPQESLSLAACATSPGLSLSVLPGESISALQAPHRASHADSDRVRVVGSENGAVELATPGNEGNTSPELKVFYSSV